MSFACGESQRGKNSFGETTRTEETSRTRCKMYILDVQLTHREKFESDACTTPVVGGALLWDCRCLMFR